MTVEEIVKQYDVAGCSFESYTYSALFRSCKEQDTFEFEAEYLAFSAHNVQRENNEVEYEYFKSKITTEIIEYWEKRIYTSVNPIFTAQYSGLVWEYKFSICNKKPDFNIALIYIKALQSILNDKLYMHYIYAISIAKKAIALSLKLGQIELLNNAKSVICRICSECEGVNAVNIWVAPYKIHKEYPKAFSHEEVQAIIIEIERRFNAIDYALSQSVDCEDCSPDDLLDVAELLAEYYFKCNETEKIRTVITKSVAAFNSRKDSIKAIVFVTTLHRISGILLKYKLNEESRMIREMAESLGSDALSDMKVFEVKSEIPRKVIDDYLSTFFVDSNIDRFFRLFVFAHIPRKEQAIKTLNSRERGFLDVMTTTRFNDKGVIMEPIGSVEEDLDQNIILQIKQDITFLYPCVKMVIVEATKKGIFTFDNVVAQIKTSPVFENSKLPIIERGIKAFFEDDHIVCLHLLIPQIEAAVCKLSKLSELPTLKLNPNTSNRYQRQLLDELLRSLGSSDSKLEDLFLYLRILLTDNRGLNLRNDICHGISDSDIFNEQRSLLILHALLTLSQFKETEA